ncbi:MAG: hypothetical protein PVH49_07630, partial [Syntrophobacterales bacterium]
FFPPKKWYSKAISGQSFQSLLEQRNLELPSRFGVLDYCKISNSKHQISNKSQIPISKHKGRFGVLKLGTRPQGGESKRSADNFGHCDLFGICDLLFGIFCHSTTQLLQLTPV